MSMTILVQFQGVRKGHAVRSSLGKARATSQAGNETEILVVGGTGRVGSAAGIHLLSSSIIQGPVKVTLAGRKAAPSVLDEVVAAAGGTSELEERSRRVEMLQLDYRDTAALADALRGKHAVLHTAGPYLNEQPAILKAAIEAGVLVYADLSDPLEYLEAALSLSEQAKASGTTAVVAAGAFPGLSNVLAMECASQLSSGVRDIKFSYFTSGLGGSGTINLLITNLGFGEPVWTLRGGRRTPQINGGLDAQRVDFYLERDDPACTRVGSRTVWSWPFPEVCTVGEALAVSGSTDVRMGTAPELWNVLLGWMARWLPRAWWRNEAFSGALAAFSWPLVALTDTFLPETHAVRIDVTGDDGSTASAVQAHRSFRECVGQSCAEFVMHMLTERSDGKARSGVFLPETLCASHEERRQLIDSLVSTPGTFTFRMQSSHAKVEA